jgi:hypothetical protein
MSSQARRRPSPHATHAPNGPRRAHSRPVLRPEYMSDAQKSAHIRDTVLQAGQDLRTRHPWLDMGFLSSLPDAPAVGAQVCAGDRS